MFLDSSACVAIEFFCINFPMKNLLEDPLIVLRCYAMEIILPMSGRDSFNTDVICEDRDAGRKSLKDFDFDSRAG